MQNKGINSGLGQQVLPAPPQHCEYISFTFKNQRYKTKTMFIINPQTGNVKHPGIAIDQYVQLYRNSLLPSDPVVNLQK